MNKDIIKKVIRQAIERGPLKNDVFRIRLFGSYLSGDNKDDSDVDLLVDYIPSVKVGFFKLIDTQEQLGKALNRKVDLLTPDALSKYFKQEVLDQAETIYEQRSGLS